MRILLFFIYIVFSVTLLQADNIRWHGNYDMAHKEALKDNKVLMVLLIEKNCLDCIKMLRETLMNKEYNKKINDLFVSVLITKGQKDSYPIELLYTMEYPSIFFLDSNELFIGENIFGYIDSEKFEKHLNLYF